MPLRQRKRLRLPGLAEVVGVVLTLVTVALGVFWMVSTATTEWDFTPGAVIRARVDHTHYNAEGTRLRVECDYEYVVGQVAHRGSWTGFWPEMGSPDSLLPDELGALQPGYPVTVFYTVSNPANSQLHGPGGYLYIVNAGLFAFACVATGFYFFRVYPALRLR